MSTTPKDLIAKRAYAIWETEGRPHGREQEHWLRAEQELSGPLRAAPAPRAASVPAPAPAPARKAAAAENRPARLTKGRKR